MFKFKISVFNYSVYRTAMFKKFLDYSKQAAAHPKAGI